MKRQLEESIKDSLIESNLWKNKLKPNCIEQNVFLAIRDNRIDFYHKGGKLFSFDKAGFKTHIKYASVIDSENERDNYLTEEKLSTCKLISDFEKCYSRIKENCSNYSGVEAVGVSEIYAHNTYLSDKNVVVLDIEVSFESDDENKKQDRIDILLLNKKTKTLFFVEAKHFSNKEIWSASTPKVIKQLNRYNGQIRKEKEHILKEYSKYIDIINELFTPLFLPTPIDIEEKVTLLIFGFDDDQKKGRLQKLIKENSEYKGVKCYCIGNINSQKADSDLERTIWKTKEL